MDLKAYPKAYFQLILASFAVVMAGGLTQAFLPIMAYSFDPFGALVGLVTSSWFITRIFVEIPSGLIMAKIGRRNILILGLSLGTISPVICALSNNIYMLILGRSIWGFGVALFFISSTVTLFDLFDIERRGRAMGTFHGIEVIGSFLGAPIGAVLAESWGFSNIFVIASTIIFIGLIATFSSSQIKIMDAHLQDGQNASSLKATISCIREWRLVAVSIINMSKALVMQGIFLTVLQLFLNQQLNFSIETIGFVMGGRTGAIICTSLLSGHISDRTGRKPLIAGSLLVEAVCLCLFSTATSFEQVLLLVVIDGAASGLVFTNLAVLMSELVSPSTRGVAVGVYRTFMDIGGITGPILFMFLYTLYGTLNAFVVAAVVFTLSAAILVTLKRPIDKR